MLMVGMQHSGKTTYLASFWYAIRNPDGQAAVSLARIPADVSYFNELLENWLRCREAGHTSVAATRIPELDLRTDGGTTVTLSMPDYSGEYVRDAWTKRRWPAELAEYLRSARAIILFLHPDQIQERVSLEEAGRNARALGADAPEGDAEAVEFDAAAVPTQVQLVEFLQFAVNRSRARVLPVAVAISAWDSILGYERPDVWLRERLPLLEQYLAANVQKVPTAVFGVSAQGESWQGEHPSMLDSDAAERSWIVDSQGRRRSDITLPVAWALGAAKL